MADKIGVVGLITSITDNVKQLIKEECIMQTAKEYHKYTTGDDVLIVEIFMDNFDNSPPLEYYSDRDEKLVRRAEWQANKRSYRSKINY